MTMLKQVSHLYLQEVELSHSPHTYESYAVFCRSLLDTVGDVPMQALDFDVLMRFIGDKAASRKRNTVRAYILRAKTFLNWCKRKGYVDENVLADMPLPKVSLKSDSERSISESDLNKLLRYAYQQNERDFAFIMLLASSGARMNALIGLQIHKLDLDRHCADVIEKGNLGQTITFNGETAVALARYLDIRPQPDPPHDYVWCHLFQRGHQPMTYSGMNALLKRYGKKAGCSKPISGHQFRHKVGQDWSRRPDVSPVDTQNKLNHLNFETTHKYYYARNSDKVRQLTDAYDILPADLRQDLYMQDTPDNIIQFPEE